MTQAALDACTAQLIASWSASDAAAASTAGASAIGINARDYGAVPDARTVKDARMANGSSTLVSATAQFSPADVGKAVKVYDVTNWVYGVRATITAYVNPITVVLSSPSPVAMTSGDVTATIGTDNAARIQAALDHAASLAKTLDINVNYPIGGGVVVDVELPVTSTGDKYLISSPLTVARNVRLGGDAMLFNNVGNTGSDVTFCVQLADGAHLGTLLLDAAHGTDITAGTATGNAHSRFGHARIWNPGTNTGQVGLQLQGFDYDVQHVWIKGGNIGIDLYQVNNVFFDTVYLMGAQTAIRVNGCQNINFDKTALDTIAISGMQIDTSHHIHANVMAFNNYDGTGGMQMQYGLLVGEYTATKVSNLDIAYQGVQTGGVGMKVSHAEDCSIKLTLSNALLFSNANGSSAFASAITYGPSLSGYLDIEVCLDGAIATPYTGTKYGNLVIRNDTNIALLPASNLGIGTASQFGGGTGVIGIADASAVPTSNPANAAILYSQGGVPKFRFADGTVLSLGTVALKSYTKATVPGASAAGAGAMIFVTDAAIGGTIAWSDGNNWKTPAAIATLA